MEKCRALLSAGANVNVRDGNENTPLMGAATYGMLETVDFLIKAKAELNAVGPNHFVGYIQFVYPGKWKVDVIVSPDANSEVLYSTQLNIK